ILPLADHNTKIILVNSPHNPTGAVMPEGELSTLHDFASERKIQLVVDEVYHPLFISGVESKSAARLPHAIILSDLSNAFCFSGLRIGWLIDRDHHRIEQYLNARSYFTISNSPMTERMATFVVQHSEKIIARAGEVIARNVKILDSFFEENREFLRWIRPEGGTICFPWLTSGKNSRPFCEAMRNDGVF